MAGTSQVKPGHPRGSAQRMDHPDSAIVLDVSTAAPHPEEMCATVRLRIGSWVSLDATARATPAGLIAVGLLVTAIVVPLLILGKSNRAG